MNFKLTNKTKNMTNEEILNHYSQLELGLNYEDAIALGQPYILIQIANLSLNHIREQVL